MSDNDAIDGCLCALVHIVWPCFVTVLCCDIANKWIYWTFWSKVHLALLMQQNAGGGGDKLGPIHYPTP